MTRKPTPRLHNSNTDWLNYKAEICNKINCEWKLKTCEDIEADTAKFIHIPQQAAELATPKQHPSAQINNIPSEIKRLVAFKRKARATWQKTPLSLTNKVLIYKRSSNRYGPTASSYVAVLPQLI
jgi:hypothetical protein